MSDYNIYENPFNPTADVIDHGDYVATEAVSTVMNVNGEPMKIFICTDKIIEDNGLKCVSNPVNFANVGSGITTPDGLFSEEIFGYTQTERNMNHGYIDLHHEFFHPYVFEILCMLHSKIKDVCAYGGERAYAIEDGKFVEIKDETDPRYDTNNSGLEFVIKNVAKLKYEKNGSRTHDDNVDFIMSLSKKEMLITKYLVIPRSYRDFSSNGTMTSIDPINKKYGRLISLCNSLTSGIAGYASHKTMYIIQEELVSLRTHGQKLIEKKEGFLHKSVLGRNTSFGTRGVISVPSLIGCDYPEDCQVNMITSGLPLSMCVEAGYPFVIKWLMDWVEQNLHGGPMVIYEPSPDNPKLGIQKEVRVKNHIDIFDNKYLKKRLEMFVRGYGGRWEPIKLELEDGGYTYAVFTGRGNASHPDSPEAATIVNRPLTWCDLIYMAAEETLADKHVYCTRYPAEDYFNITPSRLAVLSTIKTMPMYVNGKLYKHYPVINPFESEVVVSRSFIDTISVSNLHLAGYGGDYDGDTLSVKLLFSQEANEEAEEKIFNLTNYMTIGGNLIRVLGNESVLCMYNMTRRA